MPIADGRAESGAGVGADKKENDKNGSPDLRQFLPGGFNDPRAYRGMTGFQSGIDGITGPHTDIWKKIQNRYQVLQGTLQP
jgi:hypothetical protein